jgi:hypothetical protein
LYHLHAKHPLPCTLHDCLGIYIYNSFFKIFFFLPKLLSLSFLIFLIVLLPIFTVFFIISCPFPTTAPSFFPCLRRSKAFINHVDYSLFFFSYCFTIRPRLAILSPPFFPVALLIFGCGSSFLFTLVCAIVFFSLPVPYSPLLKKPTQLLVVSVYALVHSFRVIVALSSLRYLPFLRVPILNIELALQTLQTQLAHTDTDQQCCLLLPSFSLQALMFLCTFNSIFSLPTMQEWTQNTMTESQSRMTPKSISSSKRFIITPDTAHQSRHRTTVHNPKFDIYSFFLFAIS